MKDEQFEVQFNYIYMSEIEGDDKRGVLDTLKDCADIELFEQEAIQNIIDYKWNTYGKDFFLYKFYLYLIFLIFYYIDVESLDRVDDTSPRVKDALFWMCKAVGLIIQSLFFGYELVQIWIDGYDYFTDSWNYLEVSGNIFYAWGAIIDISNDKITDFGRMVISISILFTLAKVVYLLRVFRQLNFLVTMLMVVVNEIFYFMILFSIFLLTFAESFQTVQVDVSLYGRTPGILAYMV